MEVQGADVQETVVRDDNNESSSGAAMTPPNSMVPVTGGHPWMAMRFPGAAMMVPHRIMPAPYYVPYHHHHMYRQPPPLPLLPPSPQHGGSNGGSSNGDNNTIWVGDLHGWMDEDYLRSCFSSTGEVSSIKVIRNKQTGFSEGYGFVEFSTHAAAEKVLQTYSSSLMPNTDQHFRLNWAAFSMWDKRTNNGSDLSIFVGDLAADVTDTLLHETFASKYSSVKAAKVVMDPNSGRSKGYGFVRFGDENEKAQAMTEMNGVVCSGRPMRIGPATPRKSSGNQQYPSNGGYSNGGSSHHDVDSNNTTIFVGGLDPDVTEEELHQPFSQYGEITSVKIPNGKGCGFVHFVNRSDAEEALGNLNGTVIGKQTVRLSWGRNPANRQARTDYWNPWAATYYAAPYYPYAYHAIPPSPYSAYDGYAMSGTHQQQVN